MLRKVGGLFLFVFVSAPVLPAAAAELPGILAGPSNPVPACVTPGRLMAFLKSRNPDLNPRYDTIATDYMRHGEMLGMRWDYAFYQMVLETGSLSYWRGNRAGDVKASQNNFAGLGATGKGEPGESFRDVESGVRAHLEHLLLYAGRPVDNPIAERTRKVREWGVLNAWQQGIKQPISFSDLAAKWAPGTKTYVAMMQGVAERFHADVCNRPDPRPGLVQEARGPIAKDAPAAPADDAGPQRTPGAELVQRAMEKAKAEGTGRRSALGVQPAPPSVSATLLNAPLPPEAPSPSTGSAVTARAAPGPGMTPKAGPPERSGTAPRTASAATAATKAKGVTESAAPPAANQKCRVWTASYGGQKAMIIRSVIDQVVNFTVLDVNEGSEAREAEAFISAYAKNGRIAGEYTSQAQALDKAFELCPEG